MTLDTENQNITLTDTKIDVSGGTSDATVGAGGVITIGSAGGTDKIVVASASASKAVLLTTGTTAGNIDLNGKMNSNHSSTAAHVDIITGTGTFDIEQEIGDSIALASLEINASSGTGDIAVFDVGTGGSAGVSGATALGNSGTGTLTLDGDHYKFGSSVYFGDNDGLTLSSTTGSITTADGSIEF